MTTLLHTKKILYDNYGEIPPMLGFLGIDTDGGAYNRWLEARDGKHITLDTAEQLRISVSNPSAIYSRGQQQGKYEWIAPGNENALTVLDRGAGQIRTNGRFAITQWVQDVKTRLQTKRDQITKADIKDGDKYELLATDIDVHVIFSLAGGTGSGTFINLAYLIKDVLQDCKVSGYAVMGEVFRSMSNGAASQRVRSNSYGAIKDLDYLMSLTPKSKKVSIEWLDNQQRVNWRPFNALYLIDNKNRNNDTYTSVEQISQMISLALVTSVGQLSGAVAAVADNVEKNIAQGIMDVQGKVAWVAGLGVSEICYDGEKLAQIYANKARTAVIAKMKNGGSDDPSRIANDWIDANKIRENLGKDDVIDYFMSAPPAIPFSDIDDAASPAPECDQYINNIAQESNSSLDQKYQGLVGRIEPALEALIEQQINREGGVYLCQNILDTLKIQFARCDDEMKAEIDRLRNELVLKQSALASSQKELEDLMGKLFRMGKRTRVDAVKEDTVSVAVCMREIKRREYARQFYSWCLTKVGDYITQLNTMQDNLRAVIQQSFANIEALRAGIGQNSFFQYNLAMAIVDKVDCPPSDIVFNDFARMVAPNGGLWTFTQLTSEQVASAIWQYTSTLPQAQEYARQTVDNVLRSMNSDELNRVCDVVIGKAQPLLRTDLHGYHAPSQPDEGYYVGVTAQGTILNKDDLFKNRIPEANANVNIVPIGLKDRIIIFHQYCVVPAFAVSALDTFLPEYEESEKARPGTSHWDYDLYKHMSKEHYSLMPQDQASEQEHLQQWVQALLYGIVSKDTEDYYTIWSRELGGKAIEGFRVRLAKKRLDAYNMFTDKLPVIKAELAEQVDKLTSKDRALSGRLREQVKAEVDAGVYHQPGHLSLNDIPTEQLRSLYPEEFEQLNKEIEIILNM